MSSGLPSASQHPPALLSLHTRCASFGAVAMTSDSACCLVDVTATCGVGASSRSALRTPQTDIGYSPKITLPYAAYVKNHTAAIATTNPAAEIGVRTRQLGPSPCLPP